jgi:hypothetical protein
MREKFELFRLSALKRQQIEAFGETGQSREGYFTNSRLALRRSASALLGMLLLAVALLLLKANVPATETAQSLLNGAAVLIVLFNVLVLIDLTQMAFGISPDV